MNIAPTEQDIGIGEDNAKRWLRTGKCCFLPEERKWLTTLQQWGLTDSYATWIKDEPRLWSWFDYRSRGFEREPKRGLRIDLILATRSIMAGLEDCGVDQEIRAQEKPSDHCPIWCHFNLKPSHLRYQCCRRLGCARGRISRIGIKHGSGHIDDEALTVTIGTAFKRCFELSTLGANAWDEQWHRTDAFAYPRQFC